VAAVAPEDLAVAMAHFIPPAPVEVEEPEVIVVPFSHCSSVQFTKYVVAAAGQAEQPDSQTQIPQARQGSPGNRARI
jgi:hypothetical protein